MKKGNILFVSLVMIAALAGNGFCAKVQDNVKGLNLTVATFAQEDIDALSTALVLEQQQSEVLEQVGAKLAKVKEQYPESANNIARVFDAVSEIIDRMNRGGTPEFLAQNLITPLEGYLSPALVSLQKKDTGAFYATMSIIDVLYPVRQGQYSLSQIVDIPDSYMPEASRIRDTDYLIDSLEANSYNDALWLFSYLGKKEPNYKQTISIIEERFKCVLSHYNSQDFGSKVWAQNVEGCLEDFESMLTTINALNPRLYGKVIGIMNRKYLASNGKKLSIAEMKDFVILADTGLVQDPRGILDSMTAYE